MADLLTSPFLDSVPFSMSVYVIAYVSWYMLSGIKKETFGQNSFQSPALTWALKYSKRNYPTFQSGETMAPVMRAFIHCVSSECKSIDSAPYLPAITS